MSVSRDTSVVPSRAGSVVGSVVEAQAQAGARAPSVVRLRAASVVVESRAPSVAVAASRASSVAVASHAGPRAISVVEGQTSSLQSRAPSVALAASRAPSLSLSIPSTPIPAKEEPELELTIPSPLSSPPCSPGRAEHEHEHEPEVEGGVEMIDSPLSSPGPEEHRHEDEREMMVASPLSSPPRSPVDLGLDADREEEREGNGTVWSGGLLVRSGGAGGGGSQRTRWRTRCKKKMDPFSSPPSSSVDATANMNTGGNGPVWSGGLPIRSGGGGGGGGSRWTRCKRKVVHEDGDRDEGVRGKKVRLDEVDDAVAWLLGEEPEEDGKVGTKRKCMKLSGGGRGKKARIVFSDDDDEEEEEKEKEQKKSVSVSVGAKEMKGDESEASSDEEEEEEVRPKKKVGRPPKKTSFKPTKSTPSSKQQPKTRPRPKRRSPSPSSSSSSESDSDSSDSSASHKTKRSKPPPPAPNYPPCPNPELLGMLVESLALARASSMTLKTLLREVSSRHPEARRSRTEGEAGGEEDVLSWGVVVGVFGVVQSSGEVSPPFYHPAYVAVWCRWLIGFRPSHRRISTSQQRTRTRSARRY